MTPAHASAANKTFRQKGVLAESMQLWTAIWEEAATRGGGGRRGVQWSGHAGGEGRSHPSAAHPRAGMAQRAPRVLHHPAQRVLPARGHAGRGRGAPEPLASSPEATAMGRWRTIACDGAVPACIAQEEGAPRRPATAARLGVLLWRRSSTGPLTPVALPLVAIA